MKALLLAAGTGQRLRPLTERLPKCLMPVCGRPLLDIWLDMLAGAGIESVLINLHHHETLVNKFLARHPARIPVHTVYEPQLLNTGGTVLANRDFIGREPVMVIHADNLCLCDLGEFIKAHRQRPESTAITMMTYITDTPETCGIVELDERGVVTAFHEKVQEPPGDLANAAVYILEPAVLEFMHGLSGSGIDFSTEVIPEFIGRIFTYHNRVYHRDIGTVESLEAAQQEYRAFFPDSRSEAADGVPVSIQIDNLLAVLNR